MEYGFSNVRVGVDCIVYITESLWQREGWLGQKIDMGRWEAVESLTTQMRDIVVS